MLATEIIRIPNGDAALDAGPDPIWIVRFLFWERHGDVQHIVELLQKRSVGVPMGSCPFAQLFDFATLKLDGFSRILELEPLMLQLLFEVTNLKKRRLKLLGCTVVAERRNGWGR